MYAGYINIFDLGKLSKSLKKEKNLDQPLALTSNQPPVSRQHAN